jgi:protein-S-isoprenylcysteine O-methyltransferase Ste14
MEIIAREVGRAVRSALGSWARTARLCLLMLASAVIIWALIQMKN